jgi:hypothetical protein
MVSRGNAVAGIGLGIAAIVAYTHAHAIENALHHGTSSTVYADPLAGQRWTLARTDQGVDYHPAVPEPVRAIGAGVVVYSSTRDCLPYGWPDCAVIGYRLTAGPKNGGIIYVAEHLKDLARVGYRFGPGATLATALPGYPWTEWGWADCTGNAPVVSYHGSADGVPMPGGLAFARFMRELGAGTAQDPGPGADFMNCT